MKRQLLFVIGKLILKISPFLWSLRSKWSFRLHQYLGWLVIRWHHAYKLPLLGDHESDEDKKEI
jgi:hypothetical protein